MSTTPPISRRDLRQLILKLLRTDSDQDAFVLDYFHEVFRLFSSGMDRIQKINLLLKQHETAEILQALQQQYPGEVGKFLLTLEAPGPDPTEPTPTSERARATSMPHLVSLFPSDSKPERAAYGELRKYLAPKLRAGALSLWSPADALPGEQLEQARERNLKDAAVVALLVSSEFLADSELDEVVKQVLQRRTEGRCVVVPVLLGAADWKSSRFGSLQPVPRDGVPIRSRKDRDSAWVEVVEGLSQALKYRP